jgi:hypothetical protein
MFEQRQVICTPKSTELHTVHNRREVFSINLKQCTVAEASASSLNLSNLKLFHSSCINATYHLLGNTPLKPITCGRLEKSRKVPIPKMVEKSQVKLDKNCFNT